MALAIAGAALLVGSLFLTWSVQASGAAARELRATRAFSGLPLHASAWQVYTAADVLLAGLACAIVAAVWIGSRRARILAAVAVLAMGAFVAHALAAPPTNGVLLARGTATGSGYLPSGAHAGSGEPVALAALALALLGLLVPGRATGHDAPTGSAGTRA